MATFYYTQTVTYTLQVEADSAEEADQIAYETDLNAENVGSDSTGWQEDGFED